MRATTLRFPRLCLALLGVALSLALAACGFHLRGAQQLPFESMYLSFGPNSPLGTELARNIRAATKTAIVPDRAKAQAVFEVLTEWREREVISVDAQGRVREFRLRLRVTFRVHDGKGRDFIAPTPLIVQRDVSFNDQQILAKEAEETLLYRDMQSDLVQQILQRMAAAKV